jgi:ABC-type amino acid transport substrate-binding protein
MRRFLVIMTLLLTMPMLALQCFAADPLTSAERDWVQKHDIIKVGAFNDYPPFGFVDQAGNAEGISVDYWMILANKLDLKIKFEPMEFARQLESLKSGQVDSLAGIFPLKERESYFDFSKPFAEINTYIYVSKGHEKVQGFQDLKGLRVGAVKGDSGEDLARAAGLSPKEFSSYPATVAALGKGEVDAIVMDELVASFEISKQKLQEKIIRVEKPVAHGEMTLPVKKDNKVLLGILNKGISAISRQEYETIARKWLK